MSCQYVDRNGGSAGGGGGDGGCQILSGRWARRLMTRRHSRTAAALSCVISLSCDVDVSKTWAIKQMFGLTNNRALNLTIVPTSASFIMDTDTSPRRM